MLQLIKLEYKSFFRSSTLGGKIAAKIFMWLSYIYILFMTIGLAFIHGNGGAAFIKQEADVENPFLLLNSNMLFYIFAFWVVGRYFGQATPIINIKPLLLLRIKRDKIIRFSLNKTIFSFFNLISILYLLIFSLTIYSPEKFDLTQLMLWNLSMYFILYITNFLNIYLNKKDRVVIVLGVILAIVYALDYFQIFSFNPISEWIFYMFYEDKILVIIPLIILAFTYYRVIQFFKNNFFIDTGLRKKVMEAKQDNLDFLNRFGDMSTFLRNDFRLIKRSKRARTTALMSLLFILYGLIFLGTQDLLGDTMLFFGYLFSTGGFIFTFCALVPSWDSQHYPFMMCQNIKYVDYIKSKWYLGSFGVIIATIIALPIYGFFGSYHLIAVLCCGLFNLGVNSYLTLWAGAFTKVKIDLDSFKNAMGNTKALNSKTLLLTLPQMVLPLVLYWVVSTFFGHTIGCISVGSIGILGILFKDMVLNIIIKTYKIEKYSTLSAYKETN